MNYAYTDAIMEFFVKDKIPMTKMVSEINSQLMMYRQQTNEIQFNVLDSHDTPRLLTEAEGNKDLMKQVLAFTFMQPGVPCIYYGDEFAMTGEMHPDCRKCMDWTSGDQDMFAFFKELIAFRKNNQAIFSEGKMVWQQVEEERGVIELQRQINEQTVRGHFNAGKELQEIPLPKEILLSHLTSVQGTHLVISPNGFVITK